MGIKKIMPLASLVMCFLCTAILFADPTAKSPEQQATESLLLEQLTQTRDAQAKVITLNSQITALQNQVSETQAQLKVARSQVDNLIDEAKNVAAAAKAAKAPPP